MNKLVELFDRYFLSELGDREFEVHAKEPEAELLHSSVLVVGEGVVFWISTDREGVRGWPSRRRPGACRSHGTDYLGQRYALTSSVSLRAWTCNPCRRVPAGGTLRRW